MTKSYALEDIDNHLAVINEDYRKAVAGIGPKGPMTDGSARVLRSKLSLERDILAGFRAVIALIPGERVPDDTANAIERLTNKQGGHK